MPLAEVYSTGPEVRGNIITAGGFFAKCPSHGRLNEITYGDAKYAIPVAEDHNKEYHPRQLEKALR